MTKKELKQEAEEYFKSICGDYNEEYERTGKRHYWVGYDIKDAYLASAEPREKRISELEEQNLNLQTMLKAEREVRVNEDYLKRIAELEAQIEKMKCCSNCSHFKLDNNGLYSIFVCELTYPKKCKNNNKWELRR